MLVEQRESRRKRFKNHINRITRLKRSNQRLHHKLANYQRLLLLAGVATVLLGLTLGFVVSQDPDPVLLGAGRAGLKAQAERTADSLRTARGTGDAAGNKTGTEIAGGEASYYSDELAGNRTASGEVFNPDNLTAAHRTLPLGSRVRVTNVRNGKSVVVRINDRGPFARQRVIDLSRGAASEIGLLASGTGTVRLELLRS